MNRPPYLMRLVTLAAAILSLGGGPASRASQPTETPLAAAELVRELRLGGNLQSLVTAAATRTQTFQVMTAETGPGPAAKAVKEAIAQVLPRYQRQWDANLAAAYAEHFTREELQSLAREKRASPYAAAYQQRQGAVGSSMQRLSSSLLTEATTAVLSAAYKVSAQPQ
jgi:hypothetical protein